MTKKRLIITGLVFPLAVGVILLLLEHFVIVPETKPVKLTESVVEGISEIANKESETKTNDTVKEEKKGTGKYSLDKKYTKLFSLAKKVYGANSRNAEYVKVIDFAISDGNAGSAFIIAKEVYGANSRNAQLTKIINLAISQKKYDFAEVVANEVYGANSRNAEYSKILEARSKNSLTK